MPTLHEALVTEVDRWRGAGHPCEEHPAIAEILEWAADPESGTPRFLRVPQLRALETYWYLRLVEKTPRIFDLYARLFPTPSERLRALSLASPEIDRVVMDGGLEALFERIRGDDGFVARNRLEGLRETLSLAYPSYILALAMGAGKTALIGTIFATEFAMALEYPDGPFVQNALVFAPGKTILESLRELLTVPYERILPPRLHKPFAASVKITFTRDGEKDIPVVRGSLFNVVVTNTEKIRIQKETIRRGDLGALMNPSREDEARAEIANLRLRAIASLPHLAVFSDEAHHTYGQSLDRELKKVRRTVDYLAEQTQVLVVVNTTGTPYFRKQPLRDVVVWYGLSQGIRENILKDVAGNIRALEVGEDPSAFASWVIGDFFGDYGDVTLPSGAPAKLAIYFPQTEDLEAARPAIDAALARVGLSPAVALRNTSESIQEEIDAFNRLNDPDSPHRVILLVNKGTEGWNCPSLFACALARTLRSSNNFVLQAATRCLRQVPGNTRHARIYVSQENRAILDRQLQETYNETIATLAGAVRERRSARLVLRKSEPAPLRLARLTRTVVPCGEAPSDLRLAQPSAAPKTLRVTALDVRAQAGLARLLQQVGEAVEITVVPDVCDAYEAAVRLAAESRQDLWAIYDELRRLYPEREIPTAHLGPLAAQIAEQATRCEVREERVVWDVALVRRQAFDREEGASGEHTYVTEICYPKEKESLLLAAADVAKGNPRGFGFHYDPYNFDSSPEREFFLRVLDELNLRPAEVEDAYFTGGLTDPAKTDFFVEYRGEDGRWHRYTPDFVIRKRARPGDPPGSGRVLVVEIKSAQFEQATREDEKRFRRGEEPLTVEGRKAVALRKLELLDREKLRYELIFAKTGIAYDQMSPVRRFVREPEGIYGADLDLAKQLCEPILALPGPRVERIVLFGSRARGDAAPESDFDLLVVVDEIGPDSKEGYLVALYRALRDSQVVAEPWVLSRKEFDETKTLVGSLAYPAWSEGVVLYERS